MLETGTVINDRYRIIGPIGEGGMGTVYEAEHTGVGRRVAVKVLLPEFAKNSEVNGRFAREARAAAAIGHDNIIDVLDVGTHDGQPYMVMELLKGESLTARIERHGSLKPEAAAYVMGQVLAALGSAHAAGIIHRDLKPDNVFLTTKAGVRDFVKLLDFGISKFKDDGKGSSGSGKTQTGVLMGTPVYMSPEQALAKRDIDHRADLYSAGVMLYEMVTGKVPFSAESQAELLMDIVYRPNGMKSAREINPELPPEFDRIVSKAVAKDRDDRYQDAGEFVAALTPWIGSAPIASDETGAHTIPKPAKTATLTPSAWETPAPPKDVSVASAQPAPARRNTGVIGGVVIGAVLAGAAGGLFVIRSRPPTVTASAMRTSAAALTPAPVPVAAAPEAPAPAAPSTVHIDLAGLPRNADVLIDGAHVDGPHLTFDRGSTHSLRVSAAGMRPFETNIVADRDREFTIALAESTTATAPIATTPARTGRRPVAHAVAPATTSTHGTSSSASHGNPLLPVSNEF